MKPYLDACDAIAAEAGLHLSWLAVADRIELSVAPDQRMSRMLVAQFEAAVRTALIHATAMPLRLVFLLNDSGHARSAESLVHGTFRKRITGANFIAACEIAGPEPASISRDADDAVVLWIDDLTRAEPFANPYASRAKAYLFRHYPVFLDALRQRRTDHMDRKMMARLVEQRNGMDRVSYPAAPAGFGGGPTTVLFCLYWLDMGGAEAFAIQAMMTAKAAGFRVVVACDEVGRHRLLDRAGEAADAIYLIGSFGNHISKEAAYLRIIRQHRPDIIHIHHSWIIYRLLPTVRTLGLTRGVIDTTHILEHRFAGFVGEAALYSELVDYHHVVSQDLADLLVNTAKVDPKRIRLGRLHDLSRTFHPSPERWEARKPLRIAFVGRFVQQKRPYLYVEIARRLVRRFGRDAFQFTAVGEGLLRVATEDLARFAGLDGLMEFLPGSAPVRDVLAAAHVLLIPSDNEGLTLVAFEAARAGCLVVSTDVGAQREIVADELLVPRHPGACVRQMVDLIGRLAEGRLYMPALLDRQSEKLAANLAAPTGSEVCLGLYHDVLRSSNGKVAAA